MSLTAKEFAKLSSDEQRKRYTELNQHEASLYRIFYAPIGGKKIESTEPPRKYTQEERLHADRQLFDCMKRFHHVADETTFEEWIKNVKHVD